MFYDLSKYRLCLYRIVKMRIALYLNVLRIFCSSTSIGLNVVWRQLLGGSVPAVTVRDSNTLHCIVSEWVSEWMKSLIVRAGTYSRSQTISHSQPVRFELHSKPLHPPNHLLKLSSWNCVSFCLFSYWCLFKVKETDTLTQIGIRSVVVPNNTVLYV